MQYTIKGRVIKGEEYGRKLGFPTINIDRINFSKLDQKPILGVYKGIVSLNDLLYKAGIVIGPIDKNNLPKIEAHLIGYSGNAYGAIVTLKLHKYIRKFKKFKTEKELIKQIKKDIKICSLE